MRPARLVTRYMAFCPLAVVCSLLVAMGPTRASGDPILPGTDIFNSFNHDGVSDNPTIFPVFTTTQTWNKFGILDYHWNSGSGQDTVAVNGKISIYDNTSNVLIGSFTATNFDPIGTYWAAVANVTLGPGSYRIEDSDPATWSYSTTNSVVVGVDWQPNMGFSHVFASPEPSTLALLCAFAVIGLPVGIAWRKRNSVV